MKKILDLFKPFGLNSEQKKYIKDTFKPIDYDSCVDMAKQMKDIEDGKMERPFIMQELSRDKPKRGVYKITFGEFGYYYIGRSKHIPTRLKQHSREIKNFFAKNRYPSEHYLSKVFEYFKKDKLAWIFSIEILEVCDTLDELVQKEQVWLDKSKKDSRCLNLGFVATPYKPGTIDETVEEAKQRKATNATAYRFYRKRPSKTYRK